MKKTIFYIGVLLLACLHIKAQVVFSGTLYNSPAQKVYLMSLFGKVDSAIINPKSPSFTLKANVSGETFFNMFYQKKGPFVLNQFVVMPGEHINFSYDLENKTQNRWIDVTGSPFTEERISVFKRILPYKIDIEKKRKEIDSIRKNNGADSSEIVTKLQQVNNDESQANMIVQQLFDTTQSAKNASQMFDILRASFLTTDPQKELLLQAIKARFPDDNHIQRLTTEAYNPADQGLLLGVKAPEIVLKDSSGQNVELNKINYKYLLIDFWASWCKPCREESPYLIKTYDKFQQNGFQILSLSIDANVNKWKEAIQTDGTSKFLQVIDTTAAKSTYLQQYKIMSIPSNFLIDKNGIIVAKNLRGDELYKTIAKLVLSN